MMKNTFFKFTKKTFMSKISTWSYKRYMKKEQILKDTKSIYIIKEEDKLIEKIKELMEKNNFHEVLTYYNINKKIISKGNEAQVLGFLSEAKTKYENQLF